MASPMLAGTAEPSQICAGRGEECAAARSCNRRRGGSFSWTIRERSSQEDCMKGCGAVTTAMAFLFGAEASQAQSKSANELAKQCIADDKSPCSKYILGSIDALENARRIRGEPSCLADDPSSEHVVKVFIRGILASYPYADVPASVAIENIYKDKCKSPN
jgi:hypothetical protein